MKRPPALSGYRIMWLYVMFDLPVGTDNERRAANKFRNFLKDEGFQMAQFSVYLRSCSGKEAADVRVEAIRRALPPSGKVHIVRITDKQFANAHVFAGRKREHRDPPPGQLLLF